MRLSFTGEAAFELHHPLDRSVALWRALLDEGARPRHPAARPPGAVRAAAREGPRDRRDGHGARHDAAPARDGLGGPDGQAGVHRTGGAGADGRSCRRRGAGSGSRWTARRPPRARRSGRSTDGDVIGNVTGSWTSPLLGRALMLGWQRSGRHSRTAVQIDGREAVRHADARSTTRRAIVPALEPVAGLRGRGLAGRPRRAHAGRATTSTSSGSRRTRRSGSARRRSTLDDDPDAIVEAEAGFVGGAAGPRRAGGARRAHRLAAARRGRRRSPRARSPVSRRSSSSATRRCSSPRPRTPTSSERGSDGAERARRDASSRSPGTSRASATTS